MEATAPLVVRRDEAPATERPAFRPDIAGLRAVAVGVVVLYHAGVPGLRGGYVGVDVFFVVSGFLMTTLLVGEHARTGTVRVGAFYARRIRRLLPMAVLVLLSTVAAIRLLLPPLLFPALSRAAVSTAEYVHNYFLAQAGTRYLTDDAPSPFQHYWSLAVEEQFYLIWPVLIVVGLWVGRRFLVSLVVLFVVASFGACLVRVASSQPYAFFSFPTRAWELGVGGLCALIALSGRRLPDRWAGPCSWVGLALVAVAVTVYDNAVPFPGWLTLVPVLGTAAVVLGCHDGGRGTCAVLLRPWPMQWLGRVSYSLYLWHWPLLVLPAVVVGHDLSGPARAALVVAAVVLAWGTQRWVERPMRSSAPFRRTGPAVLGGVGLTAVALAASAALAVLPTLATSTLVPPLTPQAVARGVDGTVVVPANVTPALTDVSGDLPVVYGDRCQLELRDTVLRPCRFGAAAAPRRVMLLGDSHAAQWFPALEAAALDDRWALTSLTKSSCPFVDAPMWSSSQRRPYVECDTWRERVLERVRIERPDVVVLAAFSQEYRAALLGAADFDRSWAAGLAGMIRRLPPGTRVVVLGDTPRWPAPSVVCLSGALDRAGTCARPAAELTDGALAAVESRAAREAGAQYVPTLPWLCTASCPAIVGNVLVYRDRHHVTATFARLLAPQMTAEVLGPPRAMIN